MPSILTLDGAPAELDVTARRPLLTLQVDVIILHINCMLYQLRNIATFSCFEDVAPTV